MHKINTKKSLFILIGILSLHTISYAKEESPVSLCFDFAQPIKTPLKKLISGKPHSDVSDSGKLPAPKSALWGAVRGEVNSSIKKIYDLLLDHYTIKNPEKTKLRVYPQDRAGFQDFHVVMVTLPTPVMDVKWEEEWGYVITEGTPDTPKSITISYQKTSGSKFIPHLCGSIVLTSLDAEKTDVYLYEEIDALGKRSHKDTVAGHLGTLSTLRQKAKQNKVSLVSHTM